MSTLTDLVAEHTALDSADVDHLHRLAGEWDLISDLSFADLLMWVRTGPGEFLCVAQVRPTTAPTTYDQDQVGRAATAVELPYLEVAIAEGRIWREGDPDWHGDVPVRHEAVPVRRTGDGIGEPGRIIAVLGRDTNLAAARVPSQLELSYLQSAGDLCQMVAEGSFPPPVPPEEVTSAPRVGDGSLRIGTDGIVVYASPNGLSAIRRLGVVGDVHGRPLAEIVRALADDPLAGSEAAAVIAAALAGLAPAQIELEANGASVLIRALPLLPAARRIGALVLVRDVTEVRVRDRQLLSKDATIREIHHRVKNNLQTVAALLRLQARRVDNEQAKAALEEAVRRVGSIAIVHETLSLAVEETVDFDEIADRLGGMVTEVSAMTGRVRTRRAGSFGILASQSANTLAMVLTEVLQNAVEHGYASGGPGESDPVGEIVTSVDCSLGRMRVSVEDDGRGLPEGFSMDSSINLGLSIVRTLVESELGGQLSLSARLEGGTRVSIDIPAP